MQSIDASHNTLLTVGIAMMAGVFCQSLARHLRFPAIILLLAAGALLGPDGLHWVDPRSLGAGLFGLVELGVAIILFEGGLNLQSSRLRRQERPIRYLLTIGAFITLLGATTAVGLIMDWSWRLSLLFGSLVVVTGPTVVTPLLRDMRLQPRLKTILEAEGVLIDPIGAVAASLALQIVLAPSVADTLPEVAVSIVHRLGFGALAGLLGGLGLGWLLKVRHVVPHGLENIFVLASVLLLFTGCEAIVPNAGIMAVTVAGVAVGWIAGDSVRELREFKDQLTALLIGVLFILLAADVPLADVKALGWPGLGVVVMLILVVRPLSVWISTQGSTLTTPERHFIAWVAPRGIIAAAISSLTADAMQREGLPGGEALRGLVFLTIGVTVVLAGLTALPVAIFLKLRLPSRNRVAILHADGLGMVLGEELKKAGTPVVFLDNDPKRCQEAQSLGQNVVFGNALEERTLARAQFELVGTAIGLSGNEHLNSLFVSHAREYFRVPKALVALESAPPGGVPSHVAKIGADVLFDGPHDAERWDVRRRHDQIRVEYFVYEPKVAPASTDAGGKPENTTPPKESPSQQERYVILTVRRVDKISPMSTAFKLRKGDQAAVALYAPEADAARRELTERGWQPGEPLALRQDPATVVPRTETARPAGRSAE